MLIGVCLIEQDVGICYNILWLKYKGHHVTKAWTSCKAPSRVIHIEIQIRETRKYIKLCLHRLNRSVPRGRRLRSIHSEALDYEHISG